MAHNQLAAARLGQLHRHLVPDSSGRTRQQGVGAAAVAAAAAGADSGGASVEEGVLHGRQALTLSNGRMALSVLPGGGFIGAVHLTTGDPTADVNPMRVPVRAPTACHRLLM